MEWTLRGVLFVALVLALEEALTTMSRRPTLRASGGDGRIASALRDWSTIAVPEKVRLHLDSVPSAATRDWAAALPGAGSAVSWESSLTPIGVAVEPIADPKRQSRIWISAPSGSGVELSDSLGVMDSVSVRKIGSSAGPFSVHGQVRASVNGTGAVAARADSLVVRPVLILGRAGWEGKFLAAALEEYGWKVDARLAVSPGSDAVQGAIAPIDTARYSAVIVLDSSVSRFAGSIEQYVRRGGGLIAIGEGAGISSLRSILPASTGAELPPGDFTAAPPRNALAMRPLVALKPDAIPLEKRGNRTAIAARRVGRGRVVQVGYVDSWRWRMAGRGDPVEDYRNWWSSVVSGAAYAPLVANAPSGSSDPAPVATLVASLGFPATSAMPIGLGDGRRWMLLLFVVATAALVLEIFSRRLDGKP
jgi:hypothetical protein